VFTVGPMASMSVEVGTIATATCCIRPYGTLPQTDVAMPIFGKLLRDASAWA